MTRPVDVSLLRLAAEARAAVALVESVGAVRVGPVAILVGADRWLVRGAPGMVAPTWVSARAFAAALRSVRSLDLPARAGRAGVLLALREQARCGLCGGSPVGGLDEWVRAHPLGGRWR